ncbi:UvrD-helicase domain-containing protein [Methylocaldum sp.]|uniref:HelD family protein n=1 Tax=Methylocaldum sp. TaxID=1969727 RepID=UPI00321FB36C
MIDKRETEEKLHLEEVKRKLGEALEQLDARVRRYAQEIQEQKTYLWEHKADMDHVEKISTRQSVHQTVLTGEAVLAFQTRIRKLLQLPYFGRFDFVRHGEAQPLPVYVGIHNFFDEAEKKSLIYDWRAPISSMFYDYEIGEARYESPSGDISGEIVLKRQFRIRNGQMEFMLESGLNILDDVLQEELSRTSDNRMKNIVATIQRDQNAIIRNEHAPVLIIQGVAGSGKTSIALHRIAFLLYRFKDSLTSKDILIISPNKVFADYISNVLPELGEEQIGETEMDGLAHELLDYQYKFQTFFEQAALLLENEDEELRRRIQEKSSLNFLKKLDEYVAHIESTQFHPEDLWINRRLVPAWLIEEVYKKHRNLPVSERLSRVAKEIEGKIGIQYNYDITAKERTELKDSVKKMYRHATLRAIYKDFFTWMGKPELFRPAKNSILEYSDVFPLIYIKIRLEGINNRYRSIKHLLIDEMQDYTPVQYAVISKLFPCKKTILGDANQSVNPFSSSTPEAIQRVFWQASIVKLCKSYRSTYEITQFAQNISPNADLVAIERHGDKPLVLSFKNKKEEISHIRRSIDDFTNLGCRTMGIICKTQKQAEQLHKAIQGDVPKLHLLTTRSSSFMRGIVICTAHLAKGLEFDQVIVPHANDENYATVLDRNLLYVACTRAMHKLTLTYAGTITRFIPQ